MLQLRKKVRIYRGICNVWSLLILALAVVTRQSIQARTSLAQSIHECTRLEATAFIRFEPCDLLRNTKLGLIYSWIGGTIDVEDNWLAGTIVPPSPSTFLVLTEHWMWLLPMYSQLYPWHVCPGAKSTSHSNDFPFMGQKLVDCPRMF